MATGDELISLTEMGSYVGRRVSELSREMRGCGGWYQCTLPAAMASYGLHYPIARRYEPALSLLQVGRVDAIPCVPPHAEPVGLTVTDKPGWSSALRKIPCGKRSL